MSKRTNAKKYSDFYKTELGMKILECESKYITLKLKNCKKILSIGCGPAFIDARLVELNPKLTLIGLDNSKEMLEFAPSSVCKIFGNAEELGIRAQTLDAVLYITALEFIEDYRKSVSEAVRVLKPKGKVLIMMLNPDSDYFQKEYSDANSYIRKNIKHVNIKKIEKFVSHYFSLKTEYFLGIKNNRIFDTNNPKLASLYVVKGVKRL